MGQKWPETVDIKQSNHDAISGAAGHHIKTMGQMKQRTPAGCFFWERIAKGCHCVRIANEILMYFRSQRKLQGELSLSDSLDGDGENGSLSLIDVVRVDDNMLEELDLRDACAKVRRCVDTCLTGREAHIIRLRYGLSDQPPLTQREIASLCGISRSYVSRRA